VENRTGSLDGEQWTPELQAAADAGAEHRPDGEQWRTEAGRSHAGADLPSPDGEQWRNGVEHRTGSSGRRTQERRAGRRSDERVALASRRRPDGERRSRVAWSPVGSSGGYGLKSQEAWADWAVSYFLLG
jgi:hypothetical protein